MFVVFIFSLLGSPWISLTLHEMGHALAGHSMKMQIHEIRLGVGPTIFRTRRFGPEVLVGIIPFGGRVRGTPQLRLLKAARLLFYAAGPVVDLAWFSTLIVALRLGSDADAVRVALFPALAFQVLMIFSNLMPHYTRLYNERTANDMLALWQIAWTKNDFLAGHRQIYRNALRAYAGTEEPAPSRRADQIFYLLLEINSLRQPLTEQQVAALERELSTTPSRSEQLLIMDSIAIHILAGKGLRDAAYLDRLTEKALLLAPELAALKSTRSAALSRLGRHEEALTLLAEAEDGSDIRRCLNAAFRGLAHFHAGCKDEATAELEIATSILQSQNSTNLIVTRIVDGIIAEISDMVLGPRKKQASP